MKSTQVTTWRRYTTAQKKAYRVRQDRRRRDGFIEQVAGRRVDPWQSRILDELTKHRYADNFGSRVPTARVNGDRL